MEKGDIVRLKKPFEPTLWSSQEYYFGIIVGMVSAMSVEQTDVVQKSQPHAEIILYLYDPDSATVYLTYALQAVITQSGGTMNQAQVYRTHLRSLSGSKSLHHQPDKAKVELCGGVR